MTVTDLRDADDEATQHAIDMVIEEKDERATWENDEMRAALEGLAEGKSYTEVMEGVETVSRSTVNTQVNYASEYLPDDDGEEDASGGGAYEVDDEPPTESGSPTEFVDPAERAANEFRAFAEEVGEKVGMNEQFIDSTVYDIQKRGSLPDVESLGDSIDMGASGVSNGRQIRWFIGHYRDWLNEFASDVSPFVAEETLPNRGPSTDSWAGSSGAWGSSGGQSAGGGQWGNAQQPGGQPQGQTSGVIKEVMETQKELVREVRELKESGGGGQSTAAQGGDDPFETMQRMMEMREKFKELEGGDQNDEAMRVVNQQLQNLQQQMADQSRDVQADNPIQSAILSVAESGDLSVEELKELSDSVGSENDPSVIEARMEKEMKEKELEQKKERTEKLMDGLENIVGSLGSEVAQRVQQSQQQAQQNAQKQAQVSQMMNQRSAGGHSRGDNSRDRQPSGTSSSSQTPPRGDGSGVAAGFGSGGQSETSTCPRCGEEQPMSPDSDGFECVKCDYSLSSCPSPACGNLLEIEPADDHEEYQCPDCDHDATPSGDGGGISCNNCEWSGSVEDSPGQVVKCDNCGSVNAIRRGGMGGGA